MHHKEITLRILEIRIIFNENHDEICIPISNSFNYENIGYICRGYLVAKEGTYKFFDKPCPHTRDFSHELGHA